MPLTNKKDVEKLVAEASPHDGFRVVESIDAQRQALSICFYRGGVASPLPWRTDTTLCHEVWTCQSPTEADLGEKKRLQLMLQAMCRFINTGGSWRQMETTMAGMWHMCHGESKLEIPGFQLIDSFVNDEGVAEHTFADGGPFHLRWVEGEFFDVIDASEALDELKREEEELRGLPEEFEA